MRATDGRKHMWVCSSAHPDTALSRAGRNNMTGATRSTSALGKPAGMRLGRAQGGITLETAKRLVYFHSDPSRAHVLKFMKRNCCEDLSGDLCCLFRCFFLVCFFSQHSLVCAARHGILADSEKSRAGMCRCTVLLDEAF